MFLLNGDKDFKLHKIVVDSLVYVVFSAACWEELEDCYPNLNCDCVVVYDQIRMKACFNHEIKVFFKKKSQEASYMAYKRFKSLNSIITTNLKKMLVELLNKGIYHEV